MTHTTHTPGPWKVLGHGDNKHDRYVGADTTTGIVAQVYDYDMAAGNANARLIAAVPELLQVVKMAEASTDMALALLAHTALAKVEGRTL